MALPARPFPDEPQVDSDRLRRLVRARVRALPDSQPTLTALGVDDSGLVEIRSTTGEPTRALLGLRTPDRFAAIAVLAPSLVSSKTASNQDATLVAAVDRGGSELCFLASACDFVETWRPQGWLIDACRRSLGLATAPSAALPVDLSLALWLDLLLVALVEQRVSTWESAAGCCPVPLRHRSTEPQQLGQALGELVPSWSALRRAAATGAPLPVPVEPEHAAWMDDPMFARWVLGFFPDLDDLRSDVEFLAPAEIALGVDLVVAAARRVDP